MSPRTVFRHIFTNELNNITIQIDSKRRMNIEPTVNLEIQRYQRLKAMNMQRLSSLFTDLLRIVYARPLRKNSLNYTHI